jgi:hypothetical protein
MLFNEMVPWESYQFQKYFRACVEAFIRYKTLYQVVSFFLSMILMA